MKFTQTATLAACAGIAFAGPVVKRQAINDGVILNFALTLEFLEAQFYKEALANYTEADFDAAGFTGVRQYIVEVAADEQAHVDFLQGTSLNTLTNLKLELPLQVLLPPVLVHTPSQPPP
jgi:hypothetical protein